MEFKTDIEIAQACEMKPITEIAKLAHVDEKYLEQYGKYKAKVDYALLKNSTRKRNHIPHRCCSRFSQDPLSGKNLRCRSNQHLLSQSPWAKGCRCIVYQSSVKELPSPPFRWRSRKRLPQRNRSHPGNSCLCRSL